MVARAMTNAPLARSIGLMRPSFAVGMVRSYHRAHEDQSLILPNNIDNHKPEFKVSSTRRITLSTGPCLMHFASVLSPVFSLPLKSTLSKLTCCLFIVCHCQ